MRDCRAVTQTATPTRRARQAPLALTVAFWLVVAETTAEVAFVVARDDWGNLGKALIVAFFVFKVVLAHGARRLVAAGALGLLLFELVGILVALGASWAMGWRVALVANVVAVYVLVLSSLHAFPPPELPRP